MNKKSKKEIPSLYLEIYKKVLIRQEGNDYISLDKLFSIINRPIFVPRDLRHCFLKEMENMGLITKRKKRLYEINNTVKVDKLTQEYRSLLW